LEELCEICVEDVVMWFVEVFDEMKDDFIVIEIVVDEMW
jgi:hypothetical protein